jgi:perosamine synthetase
MIPIYQPYLEKYKTSALKAIYSDWISNHGIYVDLASDKLKTILNIPYCILMNNGTSATHCLFKALKYKYPHLSKIYIPNNVFIAPWNCGLQEYDASLFEVMETDPLTLNINTNEEYIKSLDKNSAIVIVHNLGNIINVPRLKHIRPDIIFVEDNCEGLFGKYEGKYTGSASFASAVSFYGNKTITTGEGGAFFTNDIDVYKFIKTYYSHGMSDVRYIHNVLGTNYRMTNVQAGFLYDQLNDIEHILYLKNKVYTTYEKLLKDLIEKNKVILLKEEESTEHSKWMFSIFIPNIKFNELEAYLLEKQIQIRPLFYDIRKHKHLQDIKITQEPLKHIENGLMLPSYPTLNDDQQQYIVNCIKEYVLLKDI